MKSPVPGTGIRLIRKGRTLPGLHGSCGMPRENRGMNASRGFSVSSLRGEGMSRPYAGEDIPESAMACPAGGHGTPGPAGADIPARIPFTGPVAQAGVP